MAGSRVSVASWLFALFSFVGPAFSQESPSLDQMPRHAYIKALDMQRFRVAAAAQLPPGLDPAPDEEPFRIEHAVPLIMVNFDDVEPPYPIDTLQDHLFGTDDLRWRPATIVRPTFRQYFEDMSYGKWQITGRCYGWYSLGNKNDFHQGTGAEFWLGVYRMIWSALEHADRNVDFSRYDTENSGPLVDENPDGNVDTVFIVHPLIAAERTNESMRSQFRSHHWSLTELGKWLKDQGKTLPGEPPYVCNDVRRDAYGNRLTDETGTVTIDDYCFVPAIHEPAVPNTDPVIPVGTYCHEYGHMLGLPDLYDRLPPINAGLDNWCLMSEGLHGHDGESPRFPVPLSAWCRFHLRWAEPHSWRSLLSQVLAPSGASPRVLKIALPRREPNWERYILVEYRSRADRQVQWKVNWDQSLVRSGVMVWLVDESVGREETPGEPNGKWPFASKGKGQCDDKDNCLIAFVQFLTNQGHQIEREGVKVALVTAADDQATFEVESSELPETTAEPPVTTIAGIDAVTEPPIDAAPPEASEVSEIAERVLWMNQFGHSTLTNEDRQFLRETPEHVLRQSLPASVAGIVKEEARKSRTIEIGEEQGASAALLWPSLRDAVEQWKRWSRDDSPVLVRTAPDGMTLEWISGINKPIEGIDVNEAALGPEDLPSGDAFGQTFVQFTDDPGIVLRPDDRQPSLASDDHDDRVLYFHQVIDYADQELPLLGYHSMINVGSDGNLQSGQFDTVPADELSITGSFQFEGEERVTAKVAEVLGIDPRRVNYCRRGVGLVNRDPQKARLGYEVCISAGPARTPIKVFVDGETDRILYVRSE